MFPQNVGFHEKAQSRCDDDFTIVPRALKALVWITAVVPIEGRVLLECCAGGRFDPDVLGPTVASHIHDK